VFWKSSFAAEVSKMVGRCETANTNRSRPAITSTSADTVAARGAEPQVHTLADVSARQPLVLPAPLAGLQRNTSVLRDAIGQAREVKTKAEIEMMSVAGMAGGLGHREAMRTSKGLEYEFQVGWRVGDGTDSHSESCQYH